MATKTHSSKTTIEGPTSVKTTTYTTEYESSSSSNYRPLIRPRGYQSIQRTSYGGGGGGGMYRREVSYGLGSAMAIPSGAYANISQSGVANIKTSRAQEKKDMQDLNERFANYIEKVRFLEAQNRKLAQELEQLKNKWGKETAAVKAMYQAELDEARKLLDEAEKEKARLEIRNTSLEEQIDELRAKMDDVNNHNASLKEQIERQNSQLIQYKSELETLRTHIDALESDRDRDKKEIARLQDALNRARSDLDGETLAHIDADNRRQTLEEELEFLKNVHEQELKELAALAYRDTTQENRDFWKSEMSSALREIQQTYDDKMDTMRGELETYYNMKIQEFRTGASRQNMETVHAKETTKKLRDQLSSLNSRLAELEAKNAQLEVENNELRRQLEEKENEWDQERLKLQGELSSLQNEMEAVLKELQELMDTKLGLELEIAAYRKLLEGEENRTGLKSIVESLVTSQFHQSSSSSSSAVIGGGGGYEEMSQISQSMDRSAGGQVVKGEMSAKTTYQRSAKGPVSIADCAADGKYITLENTGRRPEPLENWKINRVIDGGSLEPFSMPAGFTIPPGRKVRVFAKGQVSNPGPHDIEAGNFKSWGIGANITTKLINPVNEDRATHVQKTIYSS